MSPRRHRTTRSALLATLVVLAVVAGSMAGLAAGATPSASFSQSTYTVTRGQDVDIGFSHSDAATLTVGGSDVGYELAVDVGGSGSSTVTIDTYDSTSGDPTTYVSGGSPTLRNPASGSLARSLAPGEYPLELVVDNVTRDVALLVIEPRPPVDLTAMVAPGGTNLGDTDQAALVADSTPRNRIARGDLAVFRMNVTGLDRAVDPAHLAGGAPADGIRVHFEDRSPQPNGPAHSFDATDSSAVTTYWDEERSQLLVVWRTDDVAIQGTSHRYTVSVSIDHRYNDLLRENSSEASTTVAIVDPTIDLSLPDDVVVDPWDSPAVAVDGTTNLAPNTDLEIRARGATPRPFLKTATGTVTTDGSFSTTVDLSGVAPGPTFPLFVLGYMDRTLHHVTIHGDGASFDFPNQTTENGSTVVFRNVSLDAGGYVVVGRWSNDSSNVTGVSTVLAPGTHENVTVTLDSPLNESAWVTARAYMDWDENGTFDGSLDHAYTVNQTPVQRRAVVWVGPDARNDTPPTTTTTTAEPTPTTTTISVQTDPPLTPDQTNGSVPLPLWVPVVALLMGAWLARREG